MLIGAGLAAGLGRVRVGGASSQVNVGLSSIGCHASTYAALAQGFFKDEGLEVNVVDTTGGNVLMTGLANGSIDTGLSPVWSVVPPRLTAGRALGDLVITAPLQRGCIALSALASSTVQSLADLRGTNVAGTKYLFGSALAEAGLDPDADIVWSPAPAATDVFATLQTGEFAAVQSADGQGALLETVGAARMLVVNNTPPAESNYCCGCIMDASAVKSDKSRAAALTRAMMRGSAWAEAHRSEIAEVMRPLMTMPAQREITQEDMEAALAMQAFIPMADAARQSLIDQFAQYLRYGLQVDGAMDAAALISRIFLPVTDELRAASL
jgi:NitT/TauT family transport system substrate-binding protein